MFYEMESNATNIELYMRANHVSKGDATKAYKEWKKEYMTSTYLDRNTKKTQIRQRRKIKNTITGIKYNSVVEAVEKAGLTKSALYRALSGRKYCKKGWIYV